MIVQQILGAQGPIYSGFSDMNTGSKLNTHGQNYTYTYVLDIPTGRRPKVDHSAERTLVLMVTNNPGISKTEVCNELVTAETPVEVEFNHMDKHKVFWRRVLWSNVTNNELFVNNDQRYVWRSKSKAFSHKNTEPAVKHDCCSIMLRSCFSATGLCALHKVDGKTKEDYV